MILTVYVYIYSHTQLSTAKTNHSLELLILAVPVQMTTKSSQMGKCWALFETEKLRRKNTLEALTHTTLATKTQPFDQRQEMPLKDKEYMHLFCNNIWFKLVFVFNISFDEKKAFFQNSSPFREIATSTHFVSNRLNVFET